MSRTNARAIMRSRTAPTLFVAMLVVLVGGLVLLSPLLTAALTNQPADWAHLSEIGQAYGGASAVLSALALCGIAASLYFQWRLNLTTQLVAVRERHFDLIKMALEDPRLAWVGQLTGNEADVPRTMYSNLMVGHWLMLWELGQLDESALRSELRQMFSGWDSSRAWWRAVRDMWTTARGRASRSFLRIVSEECDRADGAAESRSTKRYADDSHQE